MLCSSSLARPQEPAVKPFDKTALDTTCAPCKDFFQFSNGGWLKRTEIPAAYSSWGSFSELDDRNKKVLHAIVDDAAASPGAPGTNRYKLGLFYATCMDSARAEADGPRPIADELARISGVQTPAEVQAGIARLHAMGVGVGFRFGSQQDFKNSTRVIAVIDQGGLGLPDRDYYTKTDSASVKLRASYQQHVMHTLMLLGDPPSVAEFEAQRILALETALARASLTRVERRNPDSVYHKMTVTELKALAPDIDWSAYLASANLGEVADLNVATPNFLKAADSVIAKTSILDWRSYLRWHLVSDASPWLSSAFVDEDFRFNQLLTGAKELFPRWRRCLDETNAGLGEALGQAYVEKTFTPQVKARALAMVQNLAAALRDRLNAVPWMQPATRTQALAKLDAFTRKIGYPDKWRDYSALEIRQGPFVQNVLAANQFEVRRRLNQIGKPVDRTEWRMTPPTVNAYYSSSLNEIVFPAGILQPPFFNPDADDAINYGGMGAVIGHEMTHGFDDQGRKFDAQGNLKEWWTEADAKQYTGRADLVVTQFDNYIAVDSLRLNGKLTLGENIADLGGLRIAYAALQKAMAGKPRPRPIDGFTPEQRFFLGWAQVWRQENRPETARLRVATDPHSSPKWRINGPLSNLPEFAKAFGCKAGDEMVRADSVRAEIW
ncbi:MAG: M13 family metallopeptidase [Gemmatimonadetes bacterium]|nr:M13 family metallopeptidase [Gemmatimonadota bacterium]